jgi:hypothetical protein
MVTLTVFPSMFPEAVVFDTLLRLTARLSPDCEITMKLFAEATDPTQGRVASRAASALIFHVPFTETGATNDRPLLITAASPSKGKPTSRM